jgi:hypothetical protein
MTMVFPSPGEVQIKKLDIIASSGKRLSITAQLRSLTIYESVDKPFIQCDIVILDSVGLIEALPIVGEESIELSFQTQGVNIPTNLKFKVFQLGGISTGTQNKTQAYTLRCVSDERMMNNVNVVQKGYNESIENIVRDIVRNYLESNKNFFSETTKGVQNLVIPYLPPMEAADFVRKRAVSTKYPTSNFLFFENKNGFYFRTFESLVEENASQIGNKVFSYSPTINTTQFTGKEFRNILAIHNSTRFDSNDKLQSGSIYNVVRSFDLITKSVSNTSFKYTENGSLFLGTDENGRQTTSQLFAEKYGSRTPEIYMVPKDSSKPETYIADTIGINLAYKNFLKQNRVSVMIYGDSALKVGDIITCNLPEIVGTTGRSGESKMVSGNYFITSLNHHITIEQKFIHRMNVEMIKGNY